MIKLRGRHAALVLSAAALVAAGCGSSSSSKSQPKPATVPAGAATQSTPATAPTQAHGGAYTQQVDAALSPMLKAIQGARQNPLSASAWDQVAKTAGPAAGQVAAIKPPASVASLQHQLVSLLGRIATDANSARDSINNHDAAAQKAAGQKVSQDGQELSALAAKFKAAGYSI